MKAKSAAGCAATSAAWLSAAGGCVGDGMPSGLGSQKGMPQGAMTRAGWS